MPHNDQNGAEKCTNHNQWQNDCYLILPRHELAKSQHLKFVDFFLNIYLSLLAEEKNKRDLPLMGGTRVHVTRKNTISNLQLVLLYI